MSVRRRSLGPEAEPAIPRNGEYQFLLREGPLEPLLTREMEHRAARDVDAFR
jgi:hypothetical protein